MSFSDYLENKILAHTFSGTTFTPASTLYLALYTVAPSDDGTGGTEVSTSGTCLLYTSPSPRDRG